MRTENKIAKLSGITAAAVAAVCMQANVCQAGPNTLTPGTSLIPVPAGAGVSAGATLLASTNVSWGPSLSFSGTLISKVYQNDANNPYGGLTFPYQLLLSPNSNDGVGEIAIGGYTGFGNIDVSYVTGTGDIPNAVGRSSLSINQGADVNFFYLSEIPPGDTTAIFDIQTGSTTWSPQLASISDHSAVPDVTILSPMVAVPEPPNSG